MLVLFVFVGLALVAMSISIIGTFLTRKWYIPPTLVLIALLILQTIKFDTSFFPFVIIITMVSAITSGVMHLFRMLNDKIFNEKN